MLQKNAYLSFSVDFYSLNTLHGLFPFKEEKYGACRTLQIRLLKPKGELVLMEQSQHYCPVNISFRLASHFRNKSIK